MLEQGKIYWVGRPEVSKGGRFNRQTTTVQIASMDENGKVNYTTQVYSSYGKLGTPNNVIRLTKRDFNKLINS
jgi:hypothetical protein